MCSIDISAAHSSKVLQLFEGFREENLFCDITLIAGSDYKRIPSHRAVLAASSGYFATLFSKRTKIPDNEIKLDLISSDALKHVVEFCYTGKLQLAEKQVQQLFEAAAILQVSSLLENCCQMLEEQIEETNCLAINRIAQKYNLDDLYEVSMDFIRTNFDVIYETEEFKALHEDHVWRILDEYKYSQEESFYAMMAWVNYDVFEREAFIPKLLKTIRMRELTPQFLASEVEEVCRQNNCQEMLLDAYKWHCLDGKNEPIPVPRKMNEALVIVSGRGVTMEYCSHSNEWALLGEFDQMRTNYAVVADEHHIFILGGRRGSERLNSVCLLDTFTMELVELVGMKNTRTSPGAVMMNGTLYAVGCEELHRSSVERLNLSMKDLEWESVAKMNDYRCRLGVVAQDHLLYAVGGFDSFNNRYLSSTEKYDPFSDVWKMVAPMNVARSDFGIAALKGFIYVVGGQKDDLSKTETVERYDPVEDKWTLLCSLSLARSHIGVCVFQNRIFAVAGHFDEKNKVKIFEKYNADNDQWTLMPMLEEEMDVTALVVTKIPKDNLVEW